MTSLSPRPSAAAIILLTACGAGLAWQVGIKSLVAALSESAPEWALALAPAGSASLLNLAEEKIGLRSGGRYVDAEDAGANVSPQSKAATKELLAKGIPAPMVPPDVSPADRAEARRMAEAALRIAPLDARALRVLGQTAESDAQARVFMQASVKRSMREVLATYWLMQRSFLDGDYTGAVSHADVLLRSQSLLYPYVAPLLGRIAETKDGADAVKAVLQTNPPWRREFFSAVIGGISDARTPMNLMLDMQSHGLPPTREEISFYLNFLMSKKQYPLAYYAWTQFLPPEALKNLGLLFNGNFEFQPSGLRFDWIIANDSGARIEITDRKDKPGQRALFLEFLTAQVGGGGVKQTIALAPGAYRFSGIVMGEIRARRGLRWRFGCIETPWVSIGESEAFIGRVPEWREFSAEFRVPATGCPLQEIELGVDAVSSSDRFVSGTAWFTDLKVTAKPK